MLETWPGWQNDRYPVYIAQYEQKVGKKKFLLPEMADFWQQNDPKMTRKWKISFVTQLLPEFWW